MTARTVVVTGASSGIGLDTAKVLLEHGLRVFGSVRNREDAERLQTDMGSAFTPLMFDVTDEEAVHAGAAKVREALGGRTLDGLVNNAGIAVGGPLLSLALEDFRKQLEVNLTGVLICTQAFAPLLGVDKSLKGAPGRVVNVGSVGGTNAFPFMAPYHVTKFGLEGFTDSLRRELLPFGIDASLVAPGNVSTPIWTKADRDKYAEGIHEEYVEPIDAIFDQFARMAEEGLDPDDIGEAIYHQLMDKRPPARIVVTPAKLTYLAMKYMPKRLADRIVAKRLKLSPRK